jgi:hypothetical protein
MPAGQAPELIAIGGLATAAGLESGGPANVVRLFMERYSRGPNLALGVIYSTVVDFLNQSHDTKRSSAQVVSGVRLGAILLMSMIRVPISLSLGLHLFGENLTTAAPFFAVS